MYDVTVAVCVYRQKKWLHRCLRSLSTQTMDKSKYQVIVVNDDPNERLEDIIDIFKEHINIKLINNDKNLGLPTSLNKILKSAISRYFVRVDCDDYVSSLFLTTLSNFLYYNSGPRVMNTECNYQAVACDYFKVNETAELLSRHSAEEEFLANGIMYTYESLANLGFYNEEFKMREGHELDNRFKERYKIYYLRMPLYRYRLHEGNRTNNTDETDKFDKKLDIDMARG
jgi:glycosyltransferase involved in cell wall biosynthesis